MKQNNFGLLKRDIDNILLGISKFPEIEKSVIFGSRAMGNYKKGSDIDICIFGEKINFRLVSRFSYELNEELPIPYFIDVLHFETLKNDNLKKHILENGKIIE